MKPTANVASRIKSVLPGVPQDHITRAVASFTEVEYDGPGPGWGSDPDPTRSPLSGELGRVCPPYSAKKSYSSKVRNLRLNVPKMVSWALALPAQYGVLAAAASAPLAVVVAVLTAGAGLYYSSKVELSENEATVLMAASTHGLHTPINRDWLFEKTNAIRAEYSVKALDEEAFVKALVSLEAAGCVKSVSLATYELIERIEVKD